eukprot:1520606-Rhodomonas_salina.1
MKAVSHMPVALAPPTWPAEPGPHQQTAPPSLQNCNLTFTNVKVLTFMNVQRCPNDVQSQTLIKHDDCIQKIISNVLLLGRLGFAPPSPPTLALGLCLSRGLGRGVGLGRGPVLSRRPR